MTTTDCARLYRHPGQPIESARKNIQAAIQRGKLSAVKVGRDWQIERADFDTWLASPRQVGRPRKTKGETC
jgi:excisionase family DNA binding protein